MNSYQIAHHDCNKPLPNNTVPYNKHVKLGDFKSIGGKSGQLTFIGIIKQKEWVRTLLQKIGINTTHSIPFAWDYIFNKTGSEWILEVIPKPLKNVIYGTEKAKNEGFGIGSSYNQR